jgi:hypothetical protein
MRAVFLSVVGFSVVGLLACGQKADGEPPSAAGAGAGGNAAVAGSGGLAPTAGNPVTAGSSGAAGRGGGAGVAGQGMGGRAGAGTSGASGSAGVPVATGGSGGAAAGAGSGGAAGATAGGGAGGSGMAGASGAAGSPTGAHYPFPQNQRLSRCTYPTAASPDDVQKAYAAWKSELLTSNGAGGHLRVQRPNSPGAETNSTVSEGIAYGMLLAVALDDQHTFDELWKYSQLWLDDNKLMNWYINAAGTQTLGSGGATDADEDMAWALVMADRQWGGQGTLDKAYLDYAKTQIKAIWDHEIDHSNSEFLLAGDTWGGNIVFNASYFAPNEYRVFGAVTNDATNWGHVIDTGYTILGKSLNQANGNVDNGLVPAWCDTNGAPKVPQNGGATNYQYDAARVPFRIGLDFCLNGEMRAQSYLPKISKFFAGIGASKIVDGYDLNGTPHPDPDSDPNGPQSAVFVGSAAVGAMHDATFQSFVNDAYALVATGQLLARSRYYNLSWTALTLAMLTGNFVEYPSQ